MRLRILLALLLGFSLGFKPSLKAQVTFNVNTTTDGGDADPTDGQCLDANGNCTFRAALMQATTTADEVVINLPEVPGSAYEWTNGQLYLNAGEITVNEDVDVSGASSLALRMVIKLTGADERY